MTFLLIPFFLQGFAIFFDEFYFHHKRRLPLWERIGHPIDTISVLLCFLYLIFNDPSFFHLKIYIGLSIVSCLLVTKDEFVHTEKCDAKENWLHAILFILHPITFLAASVIWFNHQDPRYLIGQAVIMTIFVIYQIVYWGFYEKNK